MKEKQTPISGRLVLALMLMTAMPAAKALPTKPAEGEPLLEETYVTASRTERPVNSIPNTITVIDEETLNEQLSIRNDLSTVLGNLIPSFSPSRQKLTSYGESFRGRDPLYLVDGVPQSNPLRDGSRDGFTIDPFMLERVEVIHGANAIHGVGASGGIINLITRKPSDVLAQRLRFSADLQEEDLSESLGYGLSYSLANTWDGKDILASISLRNSGVAYDANNVVVGFDGAQGDTMDSELVNGFLKSGVEWGQQRLSLTLSHFDIHGSNNWVPVAGNVTEGVPTSGEKGRAEGDPSSNEVTMVNVAYQHEDWLGQKLRAQMYHQDFSGTYGGGVYGTFQDPAFGASVFDQSQNNSEKRGLKLTVIKDKLADSALSVAYGLDFVSDVTYQKLVQTERAWVPETDYKNYALFAQFEYGGIENLALVGGVRHEESKLTVDDFTTLASYNGGQFVEGGDPDFNETLMNVGFTYQLSKSMRMFSNYSEGFSMPDVGRVLRGINVPNQSVETFLNLEPIVTENVELGVEFRANNINGEVSVYRSDSDLGQRLQADADGIYSVQREKTGIKGLELMLDWDMNDAHTLGMSYAYTRGQYDSNGDEKTDTDLSGANMSPDRINLRWNSDWTTQLSTRIQLNHLRDRNFKDENNENDAQFDGYTTLDASAAYRLANSVLRFAVQNLNNEDYFTYYSQTLGSNGRNFKGVGRSYSLTWEVMF